MTATQPQAETTQEITTRERILQAVLTLVSTRGLDETSVRTVAAEAGVSIGAVQHHFATKNALLMGAMEAVTAAFQEELQGRLSGAVDPRDALREFLFLLSCATEEDASASTVWVAFAARACVDPAIREVHSRDWLATEDFLAALISAAHPVIADARETAGSLLALADGLAVARAAEASRMPAERARRLMEAALAALG